MHQFIKLGNYTINTSAIAYIDWNCPLRIGYGDEGVTHYRVRVYFLSIPVSREDEPGVYYLSFSTDSREAQALREYFKNSRISQDLVKRLEMAEAIKGQQSKAPQGRILGMLLTEI